LLLAIPPTERLDLQKLAELTPLFSGADLKALVEGAIDQAIEEALRSDSAPPITMEHLEHALAELRPTTLDWLSRAKNYVAFANQDNRYKEIADFLQTAEVRRLLS
jgi:SpoVK/Ycf46/Vps4 family AAA+-type ATPase